MIPPYVRDGFQLAGTAAVLAGGTRPAFRVGDVVVKQLHARSLETEHSLELLPWLSAELASIPQTGFHLARPLAAPDGRWLLEGNWAAWEYLKGEPAGAADIPAVIEASRALHWALNRIHKHPLLDANTTAWGVAHVHCWQTPSIRIHPALIDLTHQLYSKYRPLPAMPHQLIHGDLNPANILVHPEAPPGFIDFTPFWAPADFALAIFANWIGPRQGDLSVLAHFGAIPHFDQLLLRAAVRMLLVVSELAGVQDWDNAPEKHAAELVRDLL